jgi:glutamate/tyrosine decarboxylase-like PLP-dependent enzyme
MHQAHDIAIPSREEISEVLKLIVAEADSYFNHLDNLPVRSKEVHRLLAKFNTPLPDEGSGALKALKEMIQKGLNGVVNSAGPRFFHFITGGSTPAALGADWLTTVLDQMAYAWIASPLATKLELISLAWLKELFGLPSNWGGIITTGTTMANFVSLAVARQWWGEKHGIDIAEQGFEGLPKVQVFSSGIIHPSNVKALGMIGVGRSSVRKFIQDSTGSLDIQALEHDLKNIGGSPSIIIATAGEPNTGAFDPIGQLVELAENYNAWLHVDGAFGLFAKLSQNAKDLIAGVERAHSVTVDGHKWLNVPYDCGFAFLSDLSLWGKVFTHSAEYLPSQTDKEPVLGALGPEMSRRARALPVWATLRAYGRKGITEMIEGHMEMAKYLAKLVDDAPDLERLADVPLNIVCFRYNPGELNEDKLNSINQAIGEAIIEDGRIYMGTTKYGNKVAFRPAIVNWRTRHEDVKLIVDIVLEISKTLTEKKAEPLCSRDGEDHAAPDTGRSAWVNCTC